MIPDSPLEPADGRGEASGSVFDQRGQQVQVQVNIAGDVRLASVDGWLSYDARVELVAHVPPADFVARTGPFEEALRWLLDPGKAPVAIVGPGGFGKTTLVQALCQDEAVRQRFGAGVRWVQLAEEPSDLLGVISDLVVRLGRPRPDFRTIENATKALIEALGEQTLLLVIDNVWRVEELTPLLKGGLNCVRLMTTRDPLLASAGTHVVELEVMSEAEAVQLLTADLPGTDELDAVGLAQQLHYWPLLLRLIKSALHERLMYEALSLAAAWQSIRQDLTDFGMTAFDDPRDEAARDRAVNASLNISLNQLTPDERAHYGELAIFPAAAIHWSALGRLWGMGLGQARTLCRKLQRLALLSLNEGTRTIRLHDVFRGYLQNEQQDKLVMLQQRFLDSYGLTCWTELPADEPYLWDHLAYHLIAAGREEELAGLFADDGWLQVRVARDGYIYDGYLADLTHAWQVAHAAVYRASNAAIGATQLTACIHYALIRTSINSLASNYEPALVAHAVETGTWSIERAFSAANRVVDAEKRVEMIAALLATHCCSMEQRDAVATRALEAALTIQDEERRAQALTVLAPQLTGDLSGRGLVAALAIEHEGWRTKVLVALAPQLAGNLSERGFVAALAIQDEWRRAQTLAALVPQFTGTLLERCLAATHVLHDEGNRAQVLAALISQLTGQQRTQSFEGNLGPALSIEAEESGLEALEVPTHQLTGQQRGQALDRRLAAAHKLRDEEIRVWALAVLVPQLTNQQREQVLDWSLTTAHELRDEWSRARVLAVLAPYLTGDFGERGLAIVFAITSEWWRSQALIALAPHLHGEKLARGLVAALALQFEERRARVLAALAPRLYGDLLARGLAAALALQFEGHRARVLAALAPQLSGDLLEHALAAAFELRNKESRAWALVMLAPQLTGWQREQAQDHCLTSALEIEDEKHQVEVLTALAPHLAGDLLERTLVGVLAIKYEWLRAEALAALAPQLSDDLLERGLSAAYVLQDEASRARVLTTLALRLTSQQREQALYCSLSATLAIQQEWHRTWALTALISQLTGQQRKQALDVALAAISAFQKEENRAQMLALLAPQLTGDLLELGIKATLTIRDEERRGKVLVHFLKCVPNDRGIYHETLKTIADHLWHNLHTKERSAVLSFLSNQALFSTPVMNSVTSSAVVQSILDICWKWRWV